MTDDDEWLERVTRIAAEPEALALHRAMCVAIDGYRSHFLSRKIRVGFTVIVKSDGAITIGPRH